MSARGSDVIVQADLPLPLRLKTPSDDNTLFYKSVAPAMQGGQHIMSHADKFVYAPYNKKKEILSYLLSLSRSDVI